MAITLHGRSFSRNNQEGRRDRRVVSLFLFILSVGWLQVWHENILPLHPFLDTHKTNKYFQGYFVSHSSSTTGTPTTTNSTSFSESFPIHNVLLMGQFNQNPTSAQLVQDWVSIWSNYFSQILVTGPFSLKIGNELEELGIVYRRSRDDAGWVSPYETLGNVARELLLANRSTTNQNLHIPKNTAFPGIDAILYMHDDSLLNISYILDRNDGVFPTDQFLWNGYKNESFEDIFTYFVEVEQETWENGTIRTFAASNNNERFFTDRITKFENQQYRRSVVPREFPWTNTTAYQSLLPFRVRYSSKLISGPFPKDDSSNNDGDMVSTIARFVKISPGGRWPWIDWCMKRHLVMLVEGPREVLDQYAISVEERSVENRINGETVRSIQVTRQFKFLLNMQADFFVLPMEWADEFSRLATVFADDDVFLESAVVTMGRWMMSKHQKKNISGEDGPDHKLLAQSIPLCTSWNKDRGKIAMIDVCLEQSREEGMGFYHPFKIGSGGILRYKRWQAIVQRPITDARAFSVSDRNSTTDTYTANMSDSSQAFQIKNTHKTNNHFSATAYSVSDQKSTFDNPTTKSSNASVAFSNAYSHKTNDPSLSQGYSVSDGGSTPKTPVSNSSNFSEAFPIKNVLLMGQFNYNPTSAQNVQDWVSVWSNYFSNIIVTGPFSLEIGNELEALGITYHCGRDDAGWASVYETLGNVARELLLANTTTTNHNIHKGTAFPGIDAILYMHDDSLLNISYILHRNDGVFPTDQFLWNGYENESTEDIFTYFVEVVQETWEDGTIRTFAASNNDERFFTDRIIRMEDQQYIRSVVPREFPWTSTRTKQSLFPFRVRYSSKLISGPFPKDDSSSNHSSTIDSYVKNSPGVRWPYIDWCMKRHLVMLVEGPREVLDQYAISVEERSVENRINGETVRSIQLTRQFKFLLNMQADFFVLPMEWADEFSRLATVFADDDVFLESAVVTMGRWMMSKHQKKNLSGEDGPDHKLLAQSIPLCTTWFKNRGKIAMIDACLEQSREEGMGFYHPFKIGSVGIEEFKRLQAIVQRPIPEARLALEVTKRRKW